MTEYSATDFAGINNMLSPEQVRNTPTRQDPNIELVEAVNVDIDNSMSPSRRPGQTMQLAGAAHSIWAEGGTCLFVQGDTMYTLGMDLAPVAVAAGLGTDPVSYVKVNDRVYHSNGTVTGVLDEGRVRSWGIPLGDIKFGARPAQGDMPAGTYLVAMTFIRSDGQESGAGLAQTVVLPDAGGIDVRWDVPQDMDIAHCALYVSQPNGATPMRAMFMNVELAAFVYVGGARNLPLATQWLDAPPAGQVLAAYKGQVYIGAGEFVYATTPFSFEHCDLRDYQAVDGSRITMIAPVETGLFVGTEKGLYFMAGAPFSEASMVKKMNAAVVPGTMCLADGQAVTGEAEMSGMVVALFSTADGIVMGTPDGSLTNLTRMQYQMPHGIAGAATFIAGPGSKYLVSLN